MPQDLSGGLAKIHTLDWLDGITRVASERPGSCAGLTFKKAKLSAAVGFVWFFARGSALYSAHPATRALVYHDSGIFSSLRHRAKAHQVDAAPGDILHANAWARRVCRACEMPSPMRRPVAKIGRVPRKNASRCATDPCRRPPNVTWSAWSKPSYRRQNCCGDRFHDRALQTDVSRSDHSCLINLQILQLSDLRASTSWRCRGCRYRSRMPPRLK